jgi:FkbM family methyltransferase
MTGQQHPGERSALRVLLNRNLPLPMRLMRRGMLAKARRAVTWAAGSPSPSLERLVSQVPTRDQFESDVYRYWCRQIREQPRFHRKQWEFVYILEALRQSDMLRPGRAGIGFGVGREPIPAVLAAHGCRVLATDLDPAAASTGGWEDTGQYASNKALLNDRGICPQQQFDELVTLKQVNMADLQPLAGMSCDFVWSSCALEHIGSLEAGIDFILNSLALLNPDGVAVHTTELNISSNRKTLKSGPTVLYRRRDIEALAALLRARSCEIDLNFTIDWDDAEYGGHVDVPPYTTDRHLRILLDRYISTSLGLLIHRSSQGRASRRDGPPGQEGTLSFPSETAPKPEGALSMLDMIRGLDRSELESVIRARTRTVYLGNCESLCRILGEPLIYVDTRDNSVAPHLMIDGFWEIWITQAMARCLAPGMVAVDVGANLGYYTILMGLAVGASGDVHAFEPNEHFVGLLKKSLNVCGLAQRTSVDTRAVFSSTGEMVAFSVPLGLQANAAIVGTSGEALNSSLMGHGEKDGARTVDVETVRLDDAVYGKVDFIKIDAEGAEREIWRGMSRIVRENRQIQIFLEFNNNRYGDEAGTFLDEIEGAGFKLGCVDYDGTTKGTTRERVLGHGSEDVILYLTR